MYKIIHDNVIKSIGLGNSTIKHRTILSCLARNSLQVDICNKKTAPLFPIEPLLLQIALWKQDAGQSITPAKGMELANSLIDGKLIQTRLKSFQTSIKTEPTGVVSENFWSQFVKRNRDKFKVDKGYRVAGNRTEWVTYENIELMYDLVYE